MVLVKCRVLVEVKAVHAFGERKVIYMFNC